MSIFIRSDKREMNRRGGPIRDGGSVCLTYCYALTVFLILQTILKIDLKIHKRILFNNNSRYKFQVSKLSLSEREASFIMIRLILASNKIVRF